MKIPMLFPFFAVSFAYADLLYSPRFNSALVKSEQIGGNFGYSVIESNGYLPVNPVIRNVIRFPQGIGQYPFGPQQVLYPGQPIFPFPGLFPQGPGISPPFISAPRPPPPPPAESPSQVIVDEDTVAIDSA
ncbi:hypothetical protein FQR65_LT04662 [Abscondita terminalis]|nr:hypothetical protein FQR65_LT04662 [Abscondita terminalis]